MMWLVGRRLSRWTGIGFQLVMFPAIHTVMPWALSLAGTRHGWVEGRPGLANLAGLILVAAGLYIFLLCTHEHYKAAPAGWLIEKTPHYPTPSYLLTEGPYRYSCNPIYLAELVIWLGWMVIYGSLVMVSVFTIGSLLVGPVVVRREERGLEARFGDVYREFRRTRPRWFGMARR